MNSKSVHGPPTFCLLLSYVFLFRTGCEFRMGRWRRLTQPNYTFLDYQKSHIQGKNLDSVCRYSYNANDLVICFCRGLRPRHVTSRGDHTPKPQVHPTRPESP